MSYRETVNAHLTERSKFAAPIMAYLEGDHWQGGKGFSAEFMRKQAQEVARANSYEATQRYLADLRGNLDQLFDPVGLLRECIYRHVDGVLGSEPLWYYQVGEVKAEIPTDAVTKWWNDKLILEELREAAPALLYAKDTGGRTSSVGRFFFSGPVNGSLESVLEPLEFMAVMPTQGGVLYDGNNRPFLGYYRYSKDLKEFTEYSALWENIKPDTQLGILQALRSRLDNLGGRMPPNTIFIPRPGLTCVWLESDADILTASLYELDSELTIFDMRRRALVTDTLVRNSRNLDTTSTMISAASTAGVPTYFGFNIQTAGHFEDAFGNKSSTSTLTHTNWVPTPIRAGHRDFNNLTGMAEERSDANGKSVTYATPSVQRFDIINADPLIQTLRQQKASFYNAMKQGHVQQDISAAASGAALKQHTNDYAISLNMTASVLGYGLMKLLKIPLLFARHFGISGLENVEPITKIRATAVQLTPEEEESIMNRAERGFLPWEDALSMLGIEDSNEALLKIARRRPDLNLIEGEVVSE